MMPFSQEMSKICAHNMWGGGRRREGEGIGEGHCQSVNNIRERERERKNLQSIWYIIPQYESVSVSD